MQVIQSQYDGRYVQSLSCILEWILCSNWTSCRSLSDCLDHKTYALICVHQLHWSPVSTTNDPVLFSNAEDFDHSRYEGAGHLPHIRVLHLVGEQGFAWGMNTLDHKYSCSCIILWRDWNGICWFVMRDLHVIPCLHHPKVSNSSSLTPILGLRSWSLSWPYSCWKYNISN
jgi:hypothetical protein